jgi:hypothetical protein
MLQRMAPTASQTKVRRCAHFCAPSRSKTVANGISHEAREMWLPARKINVIAIAPTPSQKRAQQLLTEGL